MTDADALRDALGDDVSRRVPAAAELPRRRRGPRGARADRAREPARWWSCRCDPLTLGVLRAARRLRRRHRGGRGAVARQPARLRRPVVRVLRRPGGVPAPDAGPDRRRDDRRRRPARLRAHAADARAAHPAREGDAQHHAPRRRSTRWPASSTCRGSGRRGHRRARRAAAAAHGVRARARWRRSTASSCCTSSRSCASSRVRLAGAASTRVIERCAAEGVNPGYPLGARLRRARGRPAGGDHRAALAGRHRPAGRGARAPCGGARHEPQRGACTALTERARSSRVASPGRRAFVAPELDVPRATTTRCPERFRRARAAAAAGDRRARDRAPLHAALDSATSTSTRASTRSARAR